MPKDIKNFLARTQKSYPEQEELDEFDDHLIRSGLYSRAVADLPNPRVLPKLFARKTRATSIETGTAVPEQGYQPLHPTSGMRERLFANRVEEAYYNNRSTLPVEWFLKQNEEDLKFFADPSFTPDIGEVLVQKGLAAYNSRLRTRLLEEEAERLYNEAFERDTFAGLFTRSAGEENAKEFQAEIEGDLLPGKRYRQTDLDQAMGIDQRSDLHRDWDDFTSRAIDGTMNFVGAFGTLFEKLALVPGMLISVDSDNWYQFFGPDLSETLFGHTVPETPEIQEARRELAIIESGGRDDELKAAIASDALPFEVWNQLQETDPATIQEFQDMYGDMAYMGFAIQFQDLRDIPELDELGDQMIEEGIIKPAQQNLDYLEESNFRAGNDTINFLNAYGRVTLGAAATAVAAALSLTDEDQQAMLRELDMASYWNSIAEDVEAGNFTPSGVLGFEGTALGFFTDLGLGALFDPTIWLFGPKAKAGSSGVRSVSTLEQTVRSPGVQWGIDGLPKVLYGEGRTPIGKASALSPFADVGLDADLLHSVGIADNAFPAQKWIQTKIGMAGDEADIAFVERLLDDVQRAELERLRSGDPTVTNLTQSLVNQGFNEPLRVSYDPILGTLVFEDGLKRLAAATDVPGATKVPLVVRVETTKPKFVDVPHRKDPQPIFSSYKTSSLGGDRLASANLKTGQIQIDVTAIRRDWETGTPYLYGQRGANSAEKLQIFYDEGYTPTEIVNRMEELGGADAYVDFVHIHEQWHVDNPKVRGHDGEVGATRAALDWLFRDSKKPRVYTIAELLESGEQLAYHGTSLDNAISAGKTGWQNGGITLDPAVAAEHAASSRVGDRPGVVMVTRVSQLPPFVQSALEKGGGLQFSDVPAGTIWFDGSYKVVTPGGTSLTALGVKPPTKLPVIPIEGGQFVRPSSLFGPETIGRVADRAAVEQVVRKALAMGADLPFARQAWSAVALGRIFRRSAGTMAGEKLVPYFTSTFNSNFIPVSGVGGVRRLFEQVQFLSAADPKWAGSWMQRILENRRALGAYQRQIVQQSNELTQLRLLEKELQRRAQGVNGWKATVPEDLDTALGTTNTERYTSLAKAHEQVMDMIGAKRAELAEAARASSGAVEWQALIDEMMDDFNRNFIATHKEWKEFVGPDGLVPWDKIHRGASRDAIGLADQPRGRLHQEELKQELKDVRAEVLKGEFQTRYDPASAIEAMQKSSGTSKGVQLPATPVELIAATTRGGARYTAFTQNAWGAATRQALHTLDAFFKTNVLATPRTFGVMSLDELVSFAGEMGWPFIQRYLQARSSMWQARIGSFFSGDLLRSGPGTRFLNPKAAERIRSLQDVPAEFQMYERMLAEHVNNQTILRQPGDLGYLRDAQSFAQQHLDNPAWRTFFEGEDAFKAWFEESMDGEAWRLRTQVAYKDANGVTRYRPLQDWREGYSMVEINWKVMEAQAVKDGLKNPARFRKAWEEAAAAYSRDPSGRTYNLPQWVYDYFGPIPGQRPVYPGASIAWESAARLFEVGAANPANFRQGLVAEIMRKNETARLRALFQSQGKRVVTDMELITELANRGLPPSAFDAINAEWLDLDMARSGVYTESYIARLAEQRARDFVNDMTYSFEQGTRAGRIGSGIFPFGRAWGDMYGRWGRSLMSRAMLRPWTQKLGALGRWGQRMSDIYSVVNPRTAAKISRIAALDFNITGGLIGERETDLDFSPLTFLPTSGSGGLSVLIPGLGPIAIAMVDKAIDLFGPDPVEDPQGYQAVIDAVSDLVPSISLHGRDFASRMLGSGNIGLALNTLTDISTGLFHNPNRSMGRLTGDLGQELQRSRAVSAVYSDPELLDMILASQDPEEATLLMAAMWRDANKKTASTSLLDNFSRWLIPVRGALDPGLDELYEVWINAARSRPDLFELPEVSDQALQQDGSLLKSLGDDVRRKFFALPQWQRELLIATNPTLAINMIGTWEWSDTAPTTLPDRDRSYQVSAGTADLTLSESLDRHNIYVQRGWVIPRDSALRGHEIIGRIISARQNSARTLYEKTAESMNELRWEVLVTDETKALLDVALNSEILEPLGITDPYVLWTKWGTQREVLLDTIYEDMGIDPDDPDNEDTIQQIRDIIKIPEVEEAWSTEWRGDDVELFSSERARAFPVRFDEETTEMAEALGIDIIEGMTGDDFINELIAYRASTESGAWNAVRYNYSAYQDERGRPFTIAEETLHDLTQNPALDADWRQELDDFVSWVSNTSEQNVHMGQLSRATQDAAVERFNRLATSGRDAPVNWDKIWRDGFQSLFGPRNWTPPVPPSPFDENGGLQPEAWRPYVRGVVDGDTILVSANKGPSLLPVPRIDLGEGETRMHKVRLLGIMAEDYSVDREAAETATEKLRRALLEAEKNGDDIYLVRDPEYVGTRTDPFGRELAWLWIGDSPYYDPDSLERGQ